MLAYPSYGRSFRLVSTTLEVVLCAFDRVRTMGRKNVIPRTNYKKSIRVSKMAATSGKPNVSYLYQEVTCLGNKGTLGLRANVECEKNKKADGGETSSAKVTFVYCIGKQIR